MSAKRVTVEPYNSMWAQNFLDIESEFLQRTSFDAYEDMPLYLKMAFAFGIFEKNTIFTVQ